jgi:hypothetical protein
MYIEAIEAFDYAQIVQFVSHLILDCLSDFVAFGGATA